MSVRRERADSRRLSRRKRWVYRLVAVTLGLSVFALAEGLCLLGGWGRPRDYPDPYVGFSDIHPLFVLNESKSRFEIPKSRRLFFASESFPAAKRPDTYRVFCLGGSTVQGRPYSTPTAFTKWLELSLTAGDDSRSWEVVNCGGISYASYRLVPILEECLNHKPDLFIICTGHNEFLEDRSYSHIKHAPLYLSRPVQRLSRLRTVTLLRSAVSRITGKTATVPEGRPTLPAETKPLLDKRRNELRAYHRDEEWHRGVVEHFEFNLRRMIRLATTADVPVVLVLPPSNLRRTPPFKSEHKSGLSDEELARWTSLVEKARKLFRSDQRRATELLEKAVQLDGRHAGAWYLLARSYDASWRTTRDDQFRLQARAAYIKARDEDICPWRIISPLENVLRRVAEQTATPLIDAHSLLESKTPDRILGDEFLVDYIHPSPVKGHQMIAQELTLQLERRGQFRPSKDWGAKREAVFRRHLKSLDSLDPEYFPRGKQALEVLLKWATGRLDVIPKDTR